MTIEEIEKVYNEITAEEIDTDNQQQEVFPPLKYQMPSVLEPVNIIVSSSSLK